MPVQTFDVVVPGPPRGQARPQPTVPSFTIAVPGDPMGQARHRGSRYGTHKTPEQEAYERDIILAWRRAGALKLIDGPYQVVMHAYIAHPESHYRKDGQLTLEGMRQGPYPAKTPDGDNILKQLDVLVAAGAVPNDAKCIRWTIEKMWAERGGARLLIRVASLRPVYPPDTEGAAHGE